MFDVVAKDTERLLLTCCAKLRDLLTTYSVHDPDIRDSVDQLEKQVRDTCEKIINR